MSDGKVSSLQAQGQWSAGDGDDNRRFLADLRSLRDTAALDFDELGARAHYPTDVLKEAESGPTLPTLPILAAYVRACDGDVPEWEERWRRLGVDPNADPSLPSRPAGASPAAVAGAKAGVSVAPPESYDAERIRAVLRGATASSDRGARGSVAARPEREGQGTATAASRVPDSPASWNGGTTWDETARWDVNQGGQAAAGWGTDASADTVIGWAADTRASWDGFQPQPKPHWDGATQALPEVSSGWDDATRSVPEASPRWDGRAQAEAGSRWDGAADAADLDGVVAHGNYYVGEAVDAFSDTAVFDVPDVAQAEAIRRDPFSADWLQNSELTSPPELEPGRQDRADASPAAEESWFTPREQTDDRPVPPERPVQASESTAPVMGFWTPSAAAQASAPTEVRRLDPPRAELPAITRAGWPGTAETPSDVLEAADRTDSVLAQGPAATAAQAIAGSAVPPAVPGPVVPPKEPRSDRFYPVRLLVVIVVAALIGSILVLLLR